MQTEVVKVTPAIAEQYLSKNIKNRSISQSRVSGYANDMKEGRWLFNPNPVSFDVTGELIDGQHRLLAVIESGCEIDMLILYGAPEASKAIIDFNRPRSASDILKIEGYADANNISALAKKIIAVENGKKAEISTHRDGGGLKSGSAIAVSVLVNPLNKTIEVLELWQKRIQFRRVESTFSIP